MTNSLRRRLRIEASEAGNSWRATSPVICRTILRGHALPDTNCDARISAEEVWAADHFQSEGATSRPPAVAAPFSQSEGGSLAAAAQGGRTRPAYQYWIAGNSADAVATPEPGLALIGGGSDGKTRALVGRQSRWRRLPRADGEQQWIYNNYISSVLSLDSVATLQIPDSTAAGDPFVAARIHEADALFITGGDQSKYVNFWDESPVEDEIYAALARGVPLGGTSAGLAVLGDYDFSAVVDTISSSEALSNPYDPAITLDGGFLKPRVSGKPAGFPERHHYGQPLCRDRLGRMVTFICGWMR
jgi:hypothetical protein